MTTVHQLKVTLNGVKPPVWRRIEVHSSSTLAELAQLLTAAMGWDGYHLHKLEVADTRYQQREFLDDSPFGRRALDESKHRLGHVLTSEGDKARWDYDFGDGWEHDIVVEAISEAEGDAMYPRCITGRRACPPEDCGGWWGYAHLLDVIADPSHPEHDEMTEWLPANFDAEHFDADEATESMQSSPRGERW